MKKLILFSILFFSYFQVNAGIEYTGPSIPGSPITGFNDGPNIELYLTHGAHIFLYDSSGTLLHTFTDSVYDQDTGVNIIYQGNGHIIASHGYRGTFSSYQYRDVFFGSYNYNGFISAGSTSSLQTLHFPSLYILDGVVYRYNSLTITDIYDPITSIWGTGTYLNIPSTSYHEMNGNYKIIYSNSEQNIYFVASTNKYYLEGVNVYGYYNFEIFNNNILGTTLEKLQFDIYYKTGITLTNFQTFTDSFGQENYYLSNCYVGGKNYTTPAGTFTGETLTFRGYLDAGSGTPIGFNFIDDKYYKNAYNGNWLKQLSYSGFSLYGSECNPTITFGGFTGNVPGYTNYIRSGVLYKYVFDAGDLTLFTGINTIGGSGSTASQFTGSGTLTDDQIVNGLFNFDIDGNGSVDTIESVLAPITFVKNLVIQLNESMKNLWSFLKALLDIGNIAFIPQTYAYTGILDQLSTRTGDFTNGNIPEMSGFYNIYNTIKYGTFFGLFFMILAIFIFLRFK